jgi:hypothetical protein
MQVIITKIRNFFLFSSSFRKYKIEEVKSIKKTRVPNIGMTLKNGMYTASKLLG